MALDDAIDKARQERDRQDEQARLKKKWETEAQQRVRKLAIEAVAWLAVERRNDLDALGMRW
ncbi:hypothetical protein [Streptomyces mexicanus]|jgi:hypothetical protein|uniref:Uncharacterized protein n=1 Tax=Streptomyces mexicanus TaxID=178566 RepID=A0A7X1I590_9ACTN|nr:hypothetical protein [Streptomyces mexicanus]MBC2868550.1 hypothetical protein [Streptomyces mexicanus]